jgi:hypothetical protein
LSLARLPDASRYYCTAHLCAYTLLKLKLRTSTIDFACELDSSSKRKLLSGGLISLASPVFTSRQIYQPRVPARRAYAIFRHRFAG